MYGGGKMTGDMDQCLFLSNCNLTIRRDAEETHWIELARTGDQFAFRWLMNRYRVRAVRLASHILHNPEEAEDVAQEAFIRAFGEIEDFRENSGFYTWLYRIVTRICFDHMRHNHVKKETSLPDGDIEMREDDFDARLLVESLLERLSPPIRAALVLWEIEGLEYEEIANILRVPVGTVRSRLNYARIRFRELYTKAMKEMEDV
jgi:RNA polymerase sigma-70 factor (ECF subfamily)